jgi:membrane associated rhomboid family serine protease
MNFINKLERKFGKHAIHNLMFYIIIMYAAGAIISIINPYFYLMYLSLDVEAVLNGQIWRLFTFIIRPPSAVSIWLILELWVYYSIGNALERQWGAFRFNLYYFTGILLNIVAIFLMYLITGRRMDFGLLFINRSLFLAFAALYPNVQFLIMFIIPIKVKYLGYLYAAYIVYEMGTALVYRDYPLAIAIAISIGNFLIYFFSTRNYKRYSPSEYNRKRKYKQAVNSGRRGTVTPFPGKNVITRHKCVICGKTELDDDNLEFRFCSKCDGDYEYCTDHIFTHEHVKKNND